MEQLVGLAQAAFMHAPEPLDGHILISKLEYAPARGGEAGGVTATETVLGLVRFTLVITGWAAAGVVMMVAAEGAVCCPFRNVATTVIWYCRQRRAHRGSAERSILV